MSVHAAHIEFGSGSHRRASDLLAECGAQRVLILAQPRWTNTARAVAEALAHRHVGTFDGITTQVPEAVVDRANALVERHRPDWLLTIGGSSAIGVAKALALQTHELRVAAIPTTYAGSERTNIWGRIRAGRKETGRDDRVRPQLVIYDPTLQCSLPVHASQQSLLNALAHSIEALYAQNGTPEARAAARKSLPLLWNALHEVSEAPTDLAVRTRALRGAWLASEALDGANMALHHKLAHVLGGSFGTPHGPTHATLLPYTLAFNHSASTVLRDAFMSELAIAQPAQALHDRMRSLGLSVSLAELGLSADDVERAATIALQKTYANPRPFTRDDIAALLQGARLARRPGAVRARPQEPPVAHDITRISNPDDTLHYQTGFGNHLHTEAEPGAVPPRINGPRVTPYGLFAEQINGTGFTVHRAHNQRTWLYRLRPAITHRPFTALAPEAAPPRFASDFSAASHTPEPLRYRPIPIPTHAVDWLDSVNTFGGAGSPVLGQGLAIHLFAATTDMTRVFVNIDGDLLLAPESGRLRIRTELGVLDVAQGELAILPRGIRFAVSLPDGPTRGFMVELYNGHFQLPERGVVGANGLADERHFKAPVASYENRVKDTVVVTKQGGRFWQTVSPHSPFDVVGWHGRYTPFKYDLRDFMSMGSVSFDHPDPSILTVLTHPLDDHGRNAVDVGAFVGRWEPTEQTFRPPFFHRNAAVEFNMVLSALPTSGGYPQGAFSFTPLLSPHGLGAHGHHHNTVHANDRPNRIPDTSIWLQFESAYQVGVLPRWLTDPGRDTDFLDQFDHYTLGALARQPQD